METDYRVSEVVPWVGVEKYLFGQIVDLGCIHRANVHLKLDRNDKTLVIGTSQDYLREQEENRLSHKVLLHYMYARSNIFGLANCGTYS
jgi:hypothetical protein